MEIKCECLSRRAGLQSPEFGFKKLRNRLVHVSAGEDLEIFRELTPSLLKEAETDMIEWFDLIGGALGYER
jgi:hypothetical protein